MVFKRLHYDDTSVTAGTVISGDTSGLIMPFDGYTGLLYTSTGSDTESVIVTFPGGEHKFTTEDVFLCGGEIAINTRIINPQRSFPYNASYTGWALPKGTRLSLNFSGAESTDDIVTVLEVFDDAGRPPFFPYNMGPLHHIRSDDITYGTTADGAKIMDIPDACTGITWMAAHGAGMNTFGYRLSKHGFLHVIPGCHSATDAAVEEVGWTYTGHKADEITSKRVYYDATAFHFTGTAVANAYAACSY